MKIAVLGAAGKMSAGVIRDLATAPEVTEIVLADLPQAKAVLDERVKNWGNGKARAAFMDLRDPASLRAALKGCAACANCTVYYFNLEVMDACFAEHVHYVDMGGLFHMCRKQMLRHDQWKGAGLTAVLGMGSAPGIVNVMARLGADLCDTVESILIRDGIVNFAVADTPLAVPYALPTILDEFTMNPYIFEDGDWKAVPPFHGPEVIEFPAPVGTQTVFATLHSEVATVPLAFKAKGLRTMSFKLALPKAFEQKLRFLVDLGLGAKEPVTVGGVSVSPRDLLVEVANRLPKSSVKPDDHKVLRVDVHGEKDSRPVDVRVEMICHPYEPWGMGTGPHSVGTPVGVAARLLASGAVTERGTLGSEACVPPKAFFEKLAERGLPATISVTRPAV